jgi:hypothetical protein
VNVLHGYLRVLVIRQRTAVESVPDRLPGIPYK